MALVNEMDYICTRERESENSPSREEREPRIKTRTGLAGGEGPMPMDASEGEEKTKRPLGANKKEGGNRGRRYCSKEAEQEPDREMTEGERKNKVANGPWSQVSPPCTMGAKSEKAMHCIAVYVYASIEHVRCHL